MQGGGVGRKMRTERTRGVLRPSDLRTHLRGPHTGPAGVETREEVQIDIERGGFHPDRRRMAKSSGRRTLANEPTERVVGDLHAGPRLLLPSAGPGSGRLETVRNNWPPSAWVRFLSCGLTWCGWGDVGRVGGGVCLLVVLCLLRVSGR